MPCSVNIFRGDQHRWCSRRGSQSARGHSGNYFLPTVTTRRDVLEYLSYIRILKENNPHFWWWWAGPPSWTWSEWRPPGLSCPARCSSDRSSACWGPTDSGSPQRNGSSQPPERTHRLTVMKQAAFRLAFGVYYTSMRSRFHLSCVAVTQVEWRHEVGVVFLHTRWSLR